VQNDLISMVNFNVTHFLANYMLCFLRTGCQDKEYRIALLIFFLKKGVLHIKVVFLGQIFF